MTGILIQTPGRSTPHRAGPGATAASGEHLIHLPHAPRRTAPNILRGSATAIGVLALIAAAVMAAGAGSARSRIVGVGATDAPSVRATEDFVFQLQDMDAQLLNGLLVNGDTSVHVPRTVSAGLYDRDRKAADGDLEAATAALAGDHDALARLHAVSDTFGLYQAQAARTLADDERDGGTVAGQAPYEIVEDYTAGHQILFGTDDTEGDAGLVQAAKDLEHASAAAIDDASSSAQDALTAATVGFLLFGLALAAVLAALQVYLFRHFRRVLNPALAAATLVALIFTAGGAGAAQSAAADFHTAKSDAFDSVIALSQAKALSAGANADESRWLLTREEPSLQMGFQEAFLASAKQIADPADEPAASLVNEYEDGILRVHVDPDHPANTGLTPDSAFGKEFRNITFSGETAAAVAAYNAYANYVKADGQLRTLRLDTPENRKTAVDFDTNADTPGSSDQLFNAYSSALDDVVALNQAHFDSAMPAARDGIGVWTWLAYLLAVLVVGLTVLGVRPRLGEYR